MAATAEDMTELFDMARRTLVVGLGMTGLSVARYLAREGVEVAIVDSRENPPGLERLRAVHERKFGTAPPGDRKDLARRIRFLESRGFNGELIQRLLRER